MMLGALIIAFASAIGAAVAWIFFLRAVHLGQRGAATLWDMTIVAMSLLVIQLWGDFGQAPEILVARIVGSGIGTWLTLAWRQS